ncbi:MAG TPA: tetratricopeptide repeat protein [Limnobacter sp.]|uniref:tetratricopeptide repeat protein n=1 Tax=Limnobacter sp. TaxID=2003368 RepID=UPI002EDACB81
MKPLSNVGLIAVGLLALANQAWALPADMVRTVQLDWAKAMYQQQDKAQEQALKALTESLQSLVETNPKDPDAYVLQGIALSSYAVAHGGLGALDLAKKARHAFEKAISLDSKAMDGAAHTNLGALYYQVPGWPLGFGNDTLAEDHLKKGLSLNPNGIDANYLYGDFLYRTGRYDEAESALNKALLAPSRPGLETADAGRRREIQALLVKVKAKK